jgi:hypothetical protein
MARSFMTAGRRRETTRETVLLRTGLWVAVGFTVAAKLCILLVSMLPLYQTLRVQGAGDGRFGCQV